MQSGYKCFDPQTNKIFHSWHGQFVENTLPFKPTFSRSNSSKTCLPHSLPSSLESTHITLPLSPTHPIQPTMCPTTLPTMSPLQFSSMLASIVWTRRHSKQATTAMLPTPFLNCFSWEDSACTHSNSISSSPIAVAFPQPPSHRRTHAMRKRSLNQIFKPKLLLNFYLATDTSPLIFPEPWTTKQALQTPEWRDAMYNELQALLKNNMWDLIQPHPFQNLVGYKWFCHINTTLMVCWFDTKHDLAPKDLINA